MISQSYNKKDRIVNLPPPLQAIGDDDESDQFLVQWLGDNKESQYTCTGISLISQWEVNGKSTGSQRDGEDQLSFILAWSMHENLTRVPFNLLEIHPQSLTGIISWRIDRPLKESQSNICWSWDVEQPRSSR